MKRKLEQESTLPLPQSNKSYYSFWNKKIWSHVELGAANYGDNVHADSSHIVKGKISPKQFSILFTTIDELILSKGKRGIFYVNDLEEKMVTYTINNLKKYINDKYPDNDIAVKPLVGDFFTIEIPMVTSIHLKNPEFWFFKTLDEEKKKTRLSYFAARSKEGLTFATYFVRDFLNRVNTLDVGYKILNFNYCPYIHADGSVITFHGNVVLFSIKSLNTLDGRLRSYSDKWECLDLSTEKTGYGCK